MKAMNRKPTRPSANQIEGDTLFEWEYKPPKYKKVLSTVGPMIVIAALWVLPQFWQWAKSLRHVSMAASWILIAFVMKGFKGQTYRLTTRGVYALESSKKNWKRLGYWSEFIDYERTESYVKLKKKGWSGKACLYFADKPENMLKILNIINENILRRS
jgi:hypothetical protein